MKRKSIVAAAAALLACVVLAPGARAASSPPNVVTIMTDDQDFRSMWAMPKTRKLLVRQGTTFANNVVNFPLCCPSRATYYTGEYAHNHGVLWNNWPQGGYYHFDGSETLPVWLQRAGYETIHIGKYLNEYGTRDPYEVPPGWNEWWGGVDPTTYDYYDFTLNHDGRVLRSFGDGPDGYSTDVYARLAEREIRDAARADQPFFLNVAPNAPHTVAVASGATREGTPAVPAPRDLAAASELEMPIYPNFNEADMSDKSALLAFFPEPFTDDVAASLARHYQGRMGSLFAVDDLVAGVHRALVRAGVAKNTVVIFTSDNGWILGEHRLYDWVTEDGNASGVKYVPFEGSSRVPLIISGPGFAEDEKVEGVTVNADLAPTILRLAGARSTLPRDGVSLLRPSRHPDDLDGRAVLIETAPNPRGVPSYKSVRTERYRLDVQQDGQEALYDLKRDPWELQSVHDDPRYDRIHQILEDALNQLATCTGRSCHVDVGKLPKPAP